MAANTKNTKKKKSRRYLTRAARRTIAALLMVSALIVAAIPATTSRAAEDEGFEEAAGGDIIITQDNLSFEFTTTGVGNNVILKKISKIDKAIPATSIDVSGEFSDGVNNYIVTEIGGAAIKYSPDVFSELTNFTANNVTDIKDNAFQGCPNLAKYEGTLTTRVGANAFQGCTKLNNCNLSQQEDGVEEIGSFAFANTGLGTMPGTKSISFIGDNAFEGSDLKSTITVPGPSNVSDSVKLGNNVFKNCKNLQTVDFSGI